MIRILIKSDSRYKIDRKTLKEGIKRILLNNGITDDVELSILIVGNRKMSLLNRQYLGRRGTTDVLSFPQQDIFSKKKEAELGFIEPPDNILRLGDIAISYPKAREQAARQNLLVDEEINLLIEHGLLHLLGIHHE